jgi:hypothetical protein
LVSNDPLVCVFARGDSESEINDDCVDEYDVGVFAGQLGELGVVVVS